MPIIGNFPFSQKAPEVELLPVSNIITKSAYEKIYIKWQDPQSLGEGATAVWAGTKLVRKTGGFPSSPEDGTVLIDSTIYNDYRDEYFIDSGIGNDIIYYYKFFPYSTTGKYSDNVNNEFTAVPTATPIGSITNMEVLSPFGENLEIKWDDPPAAIIDDGAIIAEWGGVRIVYKTNGYPAHEDDGVMAGTSTVWGQHSGSNEGFMIDGLTDGERYYIGLFPFTTDNVFSPMTVDSRGDGVPTPGIIYETPYYTIPVVFNDEQQIPEWIGYDERKLRISGDVYEKDAGDYFAIFSPQSGSLWADGTQHSREVPWNIEKAYASISADISQVYLSTEQPSITFNINTFTTTMVVTVDNPELVSITTDVIAKTITVTSLDEGVTLGETNIRVNLAASLNYFPTPEFVMPVVVGEPVFGYIYFTSISQFSISASAKNWDGVLEISNDKNNWSAWDGDIFSSNITPTSDSNFYIIYIRGVGNSYISRTRGREYTTFIFSGDYISEEGVYGYGNLNTLLDYERVLAGENIRINESGCFASLFSNCTSLVVSPKLPATFLSVSCYSNLFNGCTSLTTAPELPAIDIPGSCYYDMFNGCTSLTTAPELPATTLSYASYEGMFSGCTSLTTAPELPATMLDTTCYKNMFKECTSLIAASPILANTLAESSCFGMFSYCTSLITAPDLLATTMADSCYNSMFYNCVSLITPPELPATTLFADCYTLMFSHCTSLRTLPEFLDIVLTRDCYSSMFSHCISLTTLPNLPAITVADGCYSNMFNGCSGIKVSEVQTSESPKAWRLPSQGVIVTEPSGFWKSFMIGDTGGTFTGEPEINTTYYTS